MDNDPIVVGRCPFCYNPLLQGGGQSNICYVRLYDLWCCARCYRHNADGWSVRCEVILVQHMKRAGRSLPPRQPNGWLPRDEVRVFEIVPKE